MKKSSSPRKLIPALLAMLFLGFGAHGQFLKKLGEKAEKAAERTVERRVENKASQKTDEALDGILEPDKKGSKKQKNTAPEDNGPKSEKSGPETEIEDTTNQPDSPTSKNVPKSISVYSKYDFVPGDELLFFDDFSNDFVGDFPSKWDTNGSGEIVTVDGSSEKWFEIKAGSTYFPAISDLPEDYTIEFDLMTLGIDNKTSSSAKLDINLEENNSYDYYRAGMNTVNLKIPFVQYINADIVVWNKINGEVLINNGVSTDIREVIIDRPHIAIAVNGQRLRLWINEKKQVDIPKLVAPGAVFKHLRFFTDALEDGKDRIFIKNLKVAKGGVDLRRKLISEGSVSTSGILFDSGSANIQPSSMGIIFQISQVLQQESAMKLKIVGHTDADGNDAANMELSKKRAEAVKNALVSVYKVSAERLTTDGKGETTPVGDNATADGKAKNRRVEFIKQ